MESEFVRVEQDWYEAPTVHSICSMFFVYLNWGICWFGAGLESKFVYLEVGAGLERSLFVWSGLNVGISKNELRTSLSQLLQACDAIRLPYLARVAGGKLLLTGLD